MEFVSKHFLKPINIYAKIYFIFLSISFLKIFKKKLVAKHNKEKNYYFKVKDNKMKQVEKFFKFNNNKKKVGIIGLKHHKNVGNILVKFAIYTKLKELGVEPYIIGKHRISDDISFLNNTTHLRIINNFNEINKNDYDILMVNSDQTWRQWANFYDIAFLNFSRNWEIPKFIYGASIGLEYWGFSKETDKIAKFLLKNFTGISFREMSTTRYAKDHLGINSTFVLDPTMLINKNYYLYIINILYTYDVNLCMLI